MATPPEVFPRIIDLLGETGQLKERVGWRRIVVEKPFGTDLESAQKLNEEVHADLRERQIYRIDHYLGKETVQNILVTRFANTIFEPLWNRNYIDHVQITVAEDLGVEHRAGYYDRVGVLRDMFQNHLLQLTCLVAMEPPASFDATSLRNEKVKVLTSIQPLSPTGVASSTDPRPVQGLSAGAGGEPQLADARLLRRCACTSTTGAGRACRSICAPESSSRTSSRTWPFNSSGRRISSFAEPKPA